MDFANVKLALDPKAAKICDQQAAVESDEVTRAVWQDLAIGFRDGTDCSRESVRWLIQWSETTWSDRTGTEETRGEAAYLRRLYP